MTLIKAKGRQRIDVFNIVNIFFMCLISFVTLFPFWNILVISFSSYRDYLDNPLLLFPKKIMLDNYLFVFGSSEIIQAFFITVLVTVLGTAFNLFLTVTSAYALSIRTLPGYKLLWYIAIFTMFFNGGIIPFYILVAKWLSLQNSIFALIVPYGLNVFYMIILRSFFINIPESIPQSAKIDGANDLVILGKIIIPMSMPAIATFILFFAVERWNEWFNTMLFIQDNSKYTLQYLLREMVVRSTNPKSLNLAYGDTRQTFLVGIKMAAIVVATVPIAMVYPFLQKYFVKGVIIGAVKG